MQTNCVCLFTVVVVVLQTFAFGLATKQEDKIAVKVHETKAKAHGGNEISPQSFLKAAPLGFGIGLKTDVPKVKHHKKKGDNGITTESETTTNIGDRFKTVKTVTKQTKMGKHHKPVVVGKSVEIVTTNVFDKKKPEKFKVGKPKHNGMMFDLFNNPFGGFGLFRDLPEPQCSSKKQCKKPGMYCDKMDKQCRKKVKLDGRCDQAGQCESNKKQHVSCLWGRCSVVKESTGSGYAGLFCKHDKDCKSEDLSCAHEDDISTVSKVCIYKLSEGQTCGRMNAFSFFSLGREYDDLPCRNGLTCKALRFSNRKICRRVEKSSDDDVDEDEN